MRKRFDYAITLLGHLKAHGSGFVDVGNIAEASGLPRAYLEKVAQELKRAGWLESRKGPNGGYRLMESRESASLASLMDFYTPVRDFCPVLRMRKR